jgi:hypothetical protein
MSDTPRTDAKAVFRHDGDRIDWVHADFARSLERENARLAAELADFTRAEPLKVAERNQWRDKAKKLEAELAELKEYNRFLLEENKRLAHELAEKHSTPKDRNRGLVARLKAELAEARKLIDALNLLVDAPTTEEDEQ